MKPLLHILMTGAGAPGAAGIIKCLLQNKNIHLTVVDANEAAIGKYLHPHFFKIPKADDPIFVEELLTLCQRNEIGVLMPLVTKELLPLAENKTRFEAVGTKVLVSPPEAIKLANNKAACYHFLQQKGVRVPTFFLAKTVDEFIHAAFELGHRQRQFCFKPCHANGSRGFRIVSDGINESEQLFHYKPYNTYITYAHALKILTSQSFPPLVVTEYLPGEEYSVDCIAKNGTTVLVVPRLRERMVNGISVQGRFVNDENIVTYCTTIIKLLRLHGNIGIQLRRSESGEPLLLEINPRVQGTIVAALGAGVNLPLLAIKQELDIPITPTEMTVKWGTSFTRYWSEVFY